MARTDPRGLGYSRRVHAARDRRRAVFIGLPFVVRTVQPVLQDLDPEMEEAAVSLGASRPQLFLRVILPTILPALTTGVALAFARVRPRKKSRVERMLQTLGDALDAATDTKLSAPDVSSSKTRRAGLIAAASAVGLTAGSAGISSLRRRSESARGNS